MIAAETFESEGCCGSCLSSDFEAFSIKVRC
jgi:hypothetical protein